MSVALPMSVDACASGRLTPYVVTYMLQAVERTTVYLDDATKKLLKAAARRRHITEAEIIREALALHLRPRRLGNPRVVGRSSDQGVAQRVDEALAELGFGRFAG